MQMAAASLLKSMNNCEATSLRLRRLGCGPCEVVSSQSCDLCVALLIVSAFAQSSHVVECSRGERGQTAVRGCWWISVLCPTGLLLYGQRHRPSWCSCLRLQGAIGDNSSSGLRSLQCAGGVREATRSRATSETRRTRRASLTTTILTTRLAQDSS